MMSLTWSLTTIVSPALHISLLGGDLRNFVEGARKLQHIRQNILFVRWTRFIVETKKHGSILQIMESILCVVVGYIVMRCDKWYGAQGQRKAPEIWISRSLNWPIDNDPASKSRLPLYTKQANREVRALYVHVRMLWLGLLIMVGQPEKETSLSN